MKLHSASVARVLLAPLAESPAKLEVELPGFVSAVAVELRVLREVIARLLSFAPFASFPPARVGGSLP